VVWSIYSLLVFLAFNALTPTALGFATDGFDGIVKFPGCSGALVQLDSQTRANALVLTNGHCVSEASANSFAQNMPPINRQLTVYSKSGAGIAITVKRMIYSTMTGTDLGLIELDQTYAELREKNVHAYSLSKEPAKIGAKIEMISGFFKTIENCRIDVVAHSLREGPFLWNHSYGYDGCKSIKNTSGSPLVDSDSHKIIGLNNTRNLQGEECTLDNPCEVNAEGTTTVVRGRSYGQQSYQLLQCIDDSGGFNLNLKSCTLFGHK
jgi:hypothetical protein